MLTKQDLNLIGNLLDSKLRTLKTDVSVLKTDVSVLKTDVSVLKTDVKDLQKNMSLVNKNLKKLTKTVENDFNFHEKQNIYVIENVQKIQHELQLPVMPLFIET